MNDAPKVADAALIPERFLKDGEFCGLSWKQQVGALRELAALEAENRQLKEQVRTFETRYGFLENQRLCVGDRGGCDGNLVAIEHKEHCPARVKDMKLRPHLYESSTQEPAQTEGK